MKSKKHILSIMGLLLSCNLCLAACHQQEKSVDSSPKTTHKTKKPSAKKKKANKKEVSLQKTSERKGVSGIDFKTDDGFILTSESQIQSRTSDGIIVKHGDHTHFFFYSDLKGSRWEYLIPKDYQPSHQVTPKASTLSSASGYRLADGYVFNPKDIVAEDANGYTVRHGDHYHYIYKKDLPGPVYAASPSPVSPSPIGSPSHSSQAGIPGLDFPTDDNFLYQEGQPFTRTDLGIVVEHHGHHHMIPYDQIRQSDKWRHLLPDDQVPKKDSVEHKEVLSPEMQALLTAKLQEVAKMNPHIPIEKLLEMVHIDVKYNMITYPHGNHHHTDPIDPSKPIDWHGVEEHHHYHHHDHEEKMGDVSQETETVIGPIVTDSQDVTKLQRESLVSDHHLPVKDINSFWAVSYRIGDEPERLNYDKDRGILTANGQKGKTVTYLVRKDIPMEKANLAIPETVAKEHYFFKDWAYDLPKEGLLKGDAIINASFRHERHRNTPLVFADAFNGADVNEGDYTHVLFSTLYHGKLGIGDDLRAGFTYFVRQGTTWKDALANGLKLPTPDSTDPNYEFIDWGGHGFPDGEQLNQPVTTEIFLANFGLKRQVIASYLPSDAKNPLDTKDPNRPASDAVAAPYDAKKYFSIVFDAGEHAHFVTDSGLVKQVAMVVRRGTRWRELQAHIPTVQVEEGYQQGAWQSIIIKLNEEVSEGVYSPTVTKVQADAPNTELAKTQAPVSTEVSKAEKAEKTTETLEVPKESEEAKTEESPSKSANDQAPDFLPEDQKALWSDDSPYDDL
ncbi:pneumococcal-type histidine triad protein [Streptococcus ictaluri]|uniref:Histidine triad protein n=1 Tax=Streptococcus ictaluri 707-05 TaxID=764299 RepID=G5K4N1_9STRE|nr:pneumococcal-type histidine triad protein [Streptococcus ictaluri]EHI69208.1 histidine triad protein [Streptococcus ictaluri 707-05]